VAVRVESPSCECTHPAGSFPIPHSKFFIPPKARNLQFFRLKMLIMTYCEVNAR